MTKLITRTSVNGSSLSGANLKAALVGVVDALNSIGVTESNRTTVTSSATLTMTQCGILLVDCTSGSITLTAPTSGTSADEAFFQVRRIDSASGNTLTFQRGGTDTLEGGTSGQTIGVGQQYDFKLPAGATDWKILARGGGTQAQARAAIGSGATGDTLFTAATALAARAAMEVEPAVFPVAASVGSNALTVTLNPCLLNFRSTTLGTGTTTAVTVSGAITLTISSGSTLGTVNGVQSRIAILAINNAGTAELAAVNISGGTSLDESGLISTTAEGGAGAADSTTTIYSTTARSNVAYRVVGVVESTQATAGTWATSPSLVQGAGGEAMTSLQSLGNGQTWQNMTGSRSAATTYYNTTSRPISVCVTSNAATTIDFILTVGGVQADRHAYASASNGVISVRGIVPPGASYALTANSGTVNHWSELR